MNNHFLKIKVHTTHTTADMQHCRHYYVIISAIP